MKSSQRNKRERDRLLPSLCACPCPLRFSQTGARFCWGLCCARGSFCRGIPPPCPRGPSPPTSGIFPEWQNLWFENVSWGSSKRAVYSNKRIYRTFELTCPMHDSILKCTSTCTWMIYMTLLKKKLIMSRTVHGGGFRIYHVTYIFSMGCIKYHP